MAERGVHCRHCGEDDWYPHGQYERVHGPPRIRYRCACGKTCFADTDLSDYLRKAGARRVGGRTAVVRFFEVLAAQFVRRGLPRAIRAAREEVEISRESASKWLHIPRSELLDLLEVVSPERRELLADCLAVYRSHTSSPAKDQQPSPAKDQQPQPSPPTLTPETRAYFKEPWNGTRSALFLRALRLARTQAALVLGRLDFPSWLDQLETISSLRTSGSTVPYCGREVPSIRSHWGEYARSLASFGEDVSKHLVGLEDSPEGRAWVARWKSDAEWQAWLADQVVAVWEPEAPAAPCQVGRLIACIGWLGDAAPQLPDEVAHAMNAEILQLARWSNWRRLAAEDRQAEKGYEYWLDTRGDRAQVVIATRHRVVGHSELDLPEPAPPAVVRLLPDSLEPWVHETRLLPFHSERGLGIRLTVGPAPMPSLLDSEWQVQRYGWGLDCNTAPRGRSYWGNSRDGFIQYLDYLLGHG